MAALGSLPLMYQPGERWLYNTSAQVLGVLLARAGGRDLESVLRERIFDPLGMADTAFTVPAEHPDRLTTAYRPDPETGQLEVLDEPADSWWGSPTSFPDASGWLVSTVDDYWSFVSMLLAGGAGPGGPVLAPETVALMTTDRLTRTSGGPRRCSWASTAAGAWAWRCRPPVPAPSASMRDRLDGRHRHRLAIERPKRPSRASCSASAASRHQCQSRWPWTSGPGSTRPLRPPDLEPFYAASA
jgi:CubicO group peptidase (beta-lactamase class C family)